MGPAGRLKNEQFACPIIYGSIAVPINPARDPPAADPSHTHRWTVFVRSATGDDANLARVVKRVAFKLHESFVPQQRVIEAPPFEVTETGWGEFEIAIRISFVDSQEKPLQLFHQLQLYPKEDVGNPDGELKTIVSEHYDEIIINEPFEEFIDHLRTFKANATSKKSISATFTPQLEAEEIKKLYDTNERVMLDLEKWKLKLARVETEKRKLEAEVRALENDGVS
ncbi:yeats-domain-containing protein [Rhizoclosmatium globosum]|uniref:Yeats-domain-containing protein n=1 Tax=Rhizoclosmatium globosum TaxID=329046 RepID=A0A1Y2D320_9FUNG|nr:yeats-domain-containing protein [Rhizoclosmatium globosum]|eukprot:ORY53650.1 yeats-domain-containing protein [Rhizoclosmatium globosum]